MARNVDGRRFGAAGRVSSRAWAEDWHARLRAMVLTAVEETPWPLPGARAGCSASSCLRPMMMASAQAQTQRPPPDARKGWFLRACAVRVKPARETQE